MAVTAPEPQIDVFVTDGTWRKPEGAVRVVVEIRGGDAEDGTQGETEAFTLGAVALLDVTALPVTVGRRGGPRSRGEREPSGDGWARITTYFSETP